MLGSFALVYAFAFFSGAGLSAIASPTPTCIVVRLRTRAGSMFARIGGGELAAFAPPPPREGPMNNRDRAM